MHASSLGLRVDDGRAARGGRVAAAGGGGGEGGGEGGGGGGGGEGGGEASWCVLNASVLSASVCWFVAHVVALVHHATGDRWYMSHLGATSSLCYLAVLGPLFLGDAGAGTPKRALGSCVILAALQLVLPSYRTHEIKSYWDWTPAQRLAFNGGVGNDVVAVDVAHMLLLTVACAGLALERSLVREGVPRAPYVALAATGAASAGVQALMYRRDGEHASGPPILGAMVVAMATALALTAHYVWRSTLPVASYAGCAGAVLCFLVTAVVYAAVYDSAAFERERPRPTDVWAGAFHFFVAVVVCLHVNLTRSSCMGRWPETVALLVVVCLVQAVVFLDVPEASTRTFFVAYDVAHLVLTGLLVGVSARFLRRRPAVREGGRGRV